MKKIKKAPSAVEPEKKSNFLRPAITVVLSILSVYALMWTFTKDTLFGTSTYNSYLLQALRWLSGHLDLGQNLQHLEIAIYEGKYFISFPPIPSVILLPFAIIFGLKTPDHLIAVCIAIVGALYALKTLLRHDIEEKPAVFWTLFLTIGSNFLHIGYRADVWYFAQICAFTFTMMSFYYAAFGKKSQGWLPLFLLALAVGCRPLNMVYLPLIAYMLWQNYKTALIEKQNLWWVVPPMVVGIFLMVLNYLRFDSIFEFGHNYLPEFAQESPNGQFWIGYLPQNLGRMFRLPKLNVNHLVFPIFDGVALWLVSPIFLAWAYLLIRYGRKDIKTPTFWMLVLLPILHIVFLSCHKTLGGWQFGNRYTVDLLPAVFYAIAVYLKKEKDTLPLWIYPLFFWGLGVNLVGTIAVVNNWLQTYV